MILKINYLIIYINKNIKIVKNNGIHLIDKLSNQSIKIIHSIFTLCYKIIFDLLP